MEITIQFTSQPIVIPPMNFPGREIGACVEFHGIVRELERGEPLAGLHYEAYESMARTHLERHLRELADATPCQSVCLIHRLGWVPVGEASLYLRVLASHRAEALALCAAAIDRLKQDVPIWKRAASPSR